MRVVVYYAAFAWVVIQVGDILFDAFELSHLLRFLVAGVVCAFPVVLILSWMFNITPGGIERTAPVVAPVAAPAGSLAVIPFANLSDDSENEYFSDGLSEEIRNQLAGIRGLRVAARTSSFWFKGRHEDVREIGRRLNVAAVLEGGVRKQADVVRINLQLVSTTDGYQIWSENFEHRLEDIFRLQREIAAAVTRVVSPLSGAALPALTAPTNPSFDAYNLYLRGRHHFHKRTESALRRASGLFRRGDRARRRICSGLLRTGRCQHACSVHAITAMCRLRKPWPERCRPRSAHWSLRLNWRKTHATLGLVRENQGDLDAAGQSLRRASGIKPGLSDGPGVVWSGAGWAGPIFGRRKSVTGRLCSVTRCPR